MRFSIRHYTRYNYSHAVRLGPQHLRFYPRDDLAQRTHDYKLKINPEPQGRNDFLDLEGNRVTEVWFAEDTRHFEVEVIMEVETFRRSVFELALGETASVLPINHDNDDICARAYLERIEPDDAVTAFAAQLSLAANRDTLQFLDALNRKLFAEFAQLHRDVGAPQSPAYSLQHRSGACRDLAVLFVDCCRAEGIAARFASGYQKGNLDSAQRHLHAWPEVYLPGLGWSGFDPTHGEPAAETHVTIAAAAHSKDAMPISGTFHGEGASSKLDYAVEIQVLEN